MLIDDFSGGKNIRVTSNKLQPTEAQVYTNIDNTSGALRPLKGPLTTGVVIDEWFQYYYGNTEWISRTVDSDFVEYKDTMYISNGGALEEYSATGSRTLGILGPVATIPLSDVSLGTNPITFSEITPGTMCKGGSYNYRIAIDSSILGKTIYKDFSYTLDTYLTAGYDINVNIIGLNTSYFASGNAIRLYRETTSGYKLVGSVSYLLTGVDILDDTLNITTNTDLPSTYAKTVYNYVYTYYDSTTGRESKPSLPSPDQVNGIGSVLIGAIPISSDLTETSIDTIRVYRIGGLLTQYTLLDELAYPLVATTPYVDVKEDINIVGSHLLDSFFNEIPLSGLKYITTAHSMLFAAVDNKLYFSEIAKPYAWPATNFISFEGDIVGIGALTDVVLVFTQFKAYVITGNSPSTFSKYLFSGSQGCVSHKSIQFVDNYLIWISEDGICTTTGGAIQVVSLPMLGKVSFFKIYSTAVLDNVYYISYKEGLLDYIMAFDFRYNSIVKDITVTGRHVVSAKDSLYFFYNNVLWEMFTGTNLSMTYKSPLFTEGKHSNYKTFKDIYIKYSGNLVVTAFIDGVQSATKTLTGAEKCYNLKLGGVSKGYGIEFVVTGTGEITEIDYTVVGRQDA